MTFNLRNHVTMLALGLSALGVLSSEAIARDQILPAGTILQCVLNEPNFSSATVEVGDPVLCHLRQVAEFGEQVFPRGSYLVGHLESTKEPGHFFGKGNLRLQFDRLGLPAGDFPLNTKLIAVRNYKVDREGKIDGKGHAKRDVVEWMLPPLWPWKVITLPARGPRPKLKGETSLSLRLMDDVQIPEVSQLGRPTGVFQRQSYQKATPDLRAPVFRDLPSATANNPRCAPTFGPEWHFFGPSRCESLLDSPPALFKPELKEAPGADRAANPVAAYVAYSPAPPAIQPLPSGLPLFVGKDGNVLAVDAYSYQKGRIAYTLADGASGTFNSNEIDWAATTRLNAARGMRITLSASHPPSMIGSN